MSDDDRTKEERGQALGKQSFSKLLMSGFVYESHLRTTKEYYNIKYRKCIDKPKYIENK